MIILLFSNARIRLASATKDAALGTAREAIDQMLVRVADEMIQDAPLTDPLRESLFNDALRFYEGLLGKNESDLEIHAATARVLDLMSDVQLGLGRYDAAVDTCKRHIELVDRILAKRPADIRYRIDRAYAEEHLAYVLGLDGEESNEKEIEAHYRKAIDLFTSLERESPDLAQPMTQPLRYLSQLAIKQGKSDEAKRT